MHNSIELPRQTRGAEVRAQSFDEEANTIDIVWTTGARVRRYSWADGPYDEELDVSKSSVRLERLNAGAPFLNTHDSWDLSSVIGSVVPGSARVEGGVGVAKIQLSKREDAAGIVQDIRDGVIRNISVGYRIHRVIKEEGEDQKPALFRVVDWEPLEISAVPIPADPGSQVRSAGETNTVIVERSGAVFEEASMPEQNNAGEALRGAEIETRHAVPVAEQRDVAAEHARIEATVSERVAQAIEAEASRVSDITTDAARFDFAELGAEHVRKRTSVEEFRKVLMDEVFKRNHAAGLEAPRVSVGVEDHEKRAVAIENALLHRADPGVVELTEGGREYRGMSLLEIAREVVSARGVRVRGMAKHELAAVALETRGMMSTSDFPQILANVANKTLRAGYEAAGQTFAPLVRVVSVPDFKEVTRVQLGEAPQLEKVNEHGEFKRGSIGEAGEKYKVTTWGKVVPITRQVLVNDDMQAFTRIPRNFGVQAAALESDLVYGQITSNPTMGDGIALFHATHGNLVTAGAISAANVGLARKAMRLQKGLDGKTLLNITPSYILVPTSMETDLEMFLAQITPAKTSDVVPASLRSLTPISDPRLDAASTSNWYLASNTGQVDIIELAYLEGAQGVYTETRTGFDIDGIEVKVRLDVGAKVIDHRGLVKNPYTGS